MEQPIQAEFNSGLAIIYQLDGIERGMTQATLTQDIDLHFRYLKSYFKTLYPHLRKEFRETNLHRFKEIRNNYSIYRNAVTKGNGRVAKQIIDSFDEWELELRAAKQRHGLGMPEKDIRYQPAGKR